MNAFSEEVRGIFSVDFLFDMAGDDLRETAPDLILGVYAHHVRARGQTLELARSYGVVPHLHPAEMAKVGVTMALNQYINKKRLDDALGGTQLAVAITPEHTAEEAILLQNGRLPVAAAIGSIASAHPHSFAVEGRQDIFQLFNAEGFVLVTPVNTQGLPQVTLTVQ